LATLDEAVAVVGLARAATEAYARPDLRARVDAAHERLVDPAFRVFVVGEFKQGKSSLVNALVGTAVCAVDDDVATSVPTTVSYGPSPEAKLVPASTDIAAPGAPPDMTTVEDARAWATEGHNPANRARLRGVEMSVPADVLAGGLSLVDTPGAGGLGASHTASTIAALPSAGAVLFLTDASQELTEPEAQFLRTVTALCPNVACVLTKIDAYAHWRTIRERDLAHLHALGLDVELVPVSAALHDEAVALGDRQLDDESGVPGLVAYLRMLLADAERLRARAAAADAQWVTDQLLVQFGAERAALADPERAKPLIAALEAAKERAERLRSEASRWQQTLADGMGDLGAEVDRQLRTRTRDVLREAEDAIDQSDPAAVWDEFEPWIYRKVNEHVVAIYATFHTGAERVAQRVADHFEAENALVDVAGPAPSTALDAVSTTAELRLDLMTGGQQALSAVRGAYSGMAMFGMLAGMVGAAALGPLVIGVGALMGRKQLHDDRERQLAMLRQQAKASLRKYVDDVAFNVGNDTRDAQRLAHRQLRDHFAERAQEVFRSTTEALQAAQQAVLADDDQRTQRRRDVEAELQRIGSLRERTKALTAATTAVPAAS
jgi:hypothetical protein